MNTPIDGRTAMHLAADYGQLEVLEYIASQGADINAKDKHGISVILAAIWEGHANCVKFLLDKVLTYVLHVQCTQIIFFLVKLKSNAWHHNTLLNSLNVDIHFRYQLLRRLFSSF